MSDILSLDVESVTVKRVTRANGRASYNLWNGKDRLEAWESEMARAATHILRDCVSRGVVNVHQVCGEILDAHVRRLQREERAGGAP